ncbi:MAG TPA: cation transporter [Candidatus Limnocylindrales bacterium]|jgi:divalent metal cation (Fe/Co/Zn/Cd) transporter|nr:cation transporter [Candidatus Limnocylindrales bacterium]
MATQVITREALARRGRRLEYFTIGWNTLEGLVAIVSGAAAGSVALVGFGIDSFIEVLSGSALLWRMSVDSDEERREQNERRALRIVGLCFVALAIYVGYEAVHNLVTRDAARPSVPGIVLALAALIAMPLLSRAKRKIGDGMESAAMHADARQTDFCAYLSGILIVGLLLNRLFGLWWADPLAGLVMVPIIAKEGYDGLRARACHSCQCGH